MRTEAPSEELEAISVSNASTDRTFAESILNGMEGMTGAYVRAASRDKIQKIFREIFVIREIT